VDKNEPLKQSLQENIIENEVNSNNKTVHHFKK